MTKKLTRSLLVIVFLSFLIPVVKFSKPVFASTVTLSDGELLASDHQVPSRFEVYSQWGSASEVSRADAAGPGVLFTLSGLGGSGSGWGDNYELNALAGGTELHNADFTSYSDYALNFTNQSTHTINAHLFMNTGFTSGGSNPAYDTFWGGPWQEIGPGETVSACLDFSHAETWNALDDPVLSNRYSDGSWNPIFRLDEVTNIGFEIADFDGDTLGNQVDVLVAPVPMPGTLLLLGSGLAGLAWVRRRGFGKGSRDRSGT
jgi:hypothetical protein